MSASILRLRDKTLSQGERTGTGACSFFVKKVLDVWIARYVFWGYNFIKIFCQKM